MKKITTLLGAAIILLIAVTACHSTNHITDDATNTIGYVSDSAGWTFTPTEVLPQYGTARHADGTFSVNYTNNKLVVYLPYFGRSYTGAGAYSNTGPLDFTTTNFTLTKKETKKGHWSITIKPKDNSDVQSMSFMFYTNGNANLNVTMTNRSPINFTGTVTGFK